MSLINAQNLKCSFQFHCFKAISDIGIFFIHGCSLRAGRLGDVVFEADRSFMSDSPTQTHQQTSILLRLQVDVYVPPITKKLAT